MRLRLDLMVGLALSSLLRLSDILLRQLLVPTTQAGEDERHDVRRYARLERVSKHGLLDFPLVQLQSFLTRALFLLPSTVFFCLGLEPLPHRVVGILPLGGRWRQMGDGTRTRNRTRLTTKTFGRREIHRRHWREVAMGDIHWLVRRG